MIGEGRAWPSAVAVFLVGLMLGACDDDPIRVGPLDDPEWTVMVYMAGDNNLAWYGIQNIDDMEAAGVDPNVQVVVQAEFSPVELADSGCDASCFNRPNFNTFRYVITGEGDPAPGPDGPTIDIGNRNMTDPAELNEFVQWAQTNHPARKSLLLLWNHGGGYTGLLEDGASAGNEMMPIGELPNALGGADIDVLGFDMCMMAGYETLANIAALASVTVFSEENIPGTGYPYTPIIDALHDDPGMDGQTAAENIAEQYHAFYVGNDRSTTISAFDLEGFPALESALNSLAVSLQSRLPELAPTIASAAAASLGFEYAEMKDLVNFLDSLAVRITDEDVQARIDDLRDRALSPDFRLRSLAQVGTGDDPSDVDRSNGLDIVLPSGIEEDRFASGGPRSLAAYQAQVPGRPWTELLTEFATSHGPGPTDGSNTGTSRCRNL